MKEKDRAQLMLGTKEKQIMHFIGMNALLKVIEIECNLSLFFSMDSLNRNVT